MATPSATLVSRADLLLIYVEGLQMMCKKLKIGPFRLKSEMIDHLIAARVLYSDLSKIDLSTIHLQMKVKDQRNKRRNAS